MRLGIPICKVVRALNFLVALTHFPNAATDAAIVLRGESRKPRVSGAIVLLLLCIFVVAGAGYVEAPTLDIAA
jgi:hypothetical protein